MLLFTHATKDTFSNVNGKIWASRSRAIRKNPPPCVL